MTDIIENVKSLLGNENTLIEIYNVGNKLAISYKDENDSHHTKCCYNFDNEDIIDLQKVFGYNKVNIKVLINGNGNGNGNGNNSFLEKLGVDVPESVIISLALLGLALGLIMGSWLLLIVSIILLVAYEIFKDAFNRFYNSLKDFFKNLGVDLPDWIIWSLIISFVGILIYLSFKIIDYPYIKKEVIK